MSYEVSIHFVCPKVFAISLGVTGVLVLLLYLIIFSISFKFWFEIDISLNPNLKNLRE